MHAEPGTRVVALRNADDETVSIFGRGTYTGDAEPPRPMGAMATIFGVKTWEEWDAKMAEAVVKFRAAKVAAGEDPPEEGWLPPRPKNPRIVLDDGREVWGAECWFGPEEGFDEWVGQRKLETADLDAFRAEVAENLRRSEESLAAETCCEGHQ